MGGHQTTTVVASLELLWYHGDNIEAPKTLKITWWNLHAMVTICVLMNFDLEIVNIHVMEDQDVNTNQVSFEEIFNEGSQERTCSQIFLIYFIIACYWSYCHPYRLFYHWSSTLRQKKYLKHSNNVINPTSPAVLNSIWRKKVNYLNCSCLFRSKWCWTIRHNYWYPNKFKWWLCFTTVNVSWKWWCL